MVFARSVALRASSLARCARPARSMRIAEQSWQPSFRHAARRTYASAHGAHGPAQTSDIPWALSAVAATGVGLYLVMNQDLSHGESHDEHHEEHHDKEEAHEDEQEEEPKQEEAKAEESKDDSAEKSDSDKDDKDDKKEQPQDEAKDVKKQDDKPPSETDKPDPSKESKSQNEMSGKQQGMSNDDTNHSTNVHDNPEKSKKGEGVAETAKLKGSVDPNRPSAENKEQRGKATQDKD